MHRSSRPGHAALRIARCCAAIPALLLLTALHAHAQEPEPARDSIPRDTIAPDTIRADSIPADTAVVFQHPHGLQGFLYGLVLAPAFIMVLDLYDGPPRDTLGYARDHVHLSLAGGYATTGNSGLPGMEGWATSRNIEVLFRGWYAEWRFRKHDFAEQLILRSARFGFLHYDGRKLAGGVTLGYREGREDLARRGPEIAFPLVWGGSRRWIRYDISYLLGTHDASWNYRLRGEWLIPRTPFYTGFDFDGSQTLRKNAGIATGSFELVLGFRR